MENCYLIKESELLNRIIKAIKRNEHGLLDFLVQDILRDKNFKNLLDREIRIEKEQEEPEKAMVIKIDLSREGVPDNTFRLYLSGTGTILIDWGDGNSLEVDLDTSGVNFYEHQYENVGNYTVKVYGQEDFPGQEIYFGSGALLDNYYNRSIEEIETWGNLRLVSLSGALSYTMGPLTVPNNLPETVINLSHLLRGSTVSEVINMQDWNTSSVESMSLMFFGATDFNQDIGGWNTQNVRLMTGMFSGATSFNQDIGGWNTQNVMNMNGMFSGATSFNQNLSGWCVGLIFPDPPGFRINSGFEDNDAFQPIWGTCPS